ncbi:hypothetical protein [Halomonas sp. M20]|uniref:hypothetical protein n=1 Tax=Halomonas sp. M20 TaxID=2763264 RepID=UPI001D0B9501|nr:hypothetical protein [Halomonas sp. M20]
MTGSVGPVDVSSRTALLHQKVSVKARSAGEGYSLFKLRNAEWRFLLRNPKGWASFYPLLR